MRLIGYARVSSVSQAQGYGLEVQRRAIEGYCALHGHELLGIEEEVRSALKSRPVFERVKEKVLNGGADKLIAYRLDCIGRSLKDLATIAEEFQRGEGSDLRAERHRHLDPEGKLLFNRLRPLMVKIH